MSKKIPDPFEDISERLHEITTKLRMEYKKLIGNNFTKPELIDNVEQIMMTVVCSFAGQVIWEFCDDAIKPEYVEETFNKLAATISDSVIKGFKQSFDAHTKGLH